MRKGLTVMGAIILAIGIAIIAIRNIARAADITRVGGRIGGLIGLLLIVLGVILHVVGLVSKPAQSGGDSFRMGY